MTVPLDAVIRALRCYPNGVSTHDLAAHLGLEQRALSSRLTKQFMWGGPVDRDVTRNPRGGRFMMWRAKR